jgi:glycerol-3-phosphate dehydrogenase
MAEDAVNAAVGTLDGPAPACRTRDVPLVGADGWSELWASRQRLSERWRVPLDEVEHLLRRHGSEAIEVITLMERQPELRRRLGPHGRYLAAEVVHAVTAEGALHVADVLVRRTRLAMEATDGGASLAEDVARLMAPHLGWTESRQSEEVQLYGDQLRAARVADGECATLASPTRASG